MDLGQLTANIGESAKGAIAGGPKLPELPTIPSIAELPAPTCPLAPPPTNVVPSITPVIPEPTVPPLPTQSVPPSTIDPEIESELLVIPPLNLTLPQPPAMEIPAPKELPSIPPVAMPTMGMTTVCADCQTGMAKLGVNPVAQKTIALKEDTNTTLLNLKGIFTSSLSGESEYNSAMAEFRDMAPKWLDKSSHPTTEEGWRALCEETTTKYMAVHTFMTDRWFDGYYKACHILASAESKATSDAMTDPVDYALSALICDNPLLQTLFTTCITKYNVALTKTLQYIDDVEFTISNNIQYMCQEAGTFFGGESYAFWKLYDTEASPEISIGGWFEKWFMLNGRSYYINSSGVKIDLMAVHTYGKSFSDRIDEINKMLPA